MARTARNPYNTTDSYTDGDWVTDAHDVLRDLHDEHMQMYALHAVDAYRNRDGLRWQWDPEQTKASAKLAQVIDEQIRAALSY